MSNNQQTPEPKPAPYEWIYAEIDGYQRCIGLIQGNRDVMIATGDGQSSWLDFAPTAKTMILRAIERARQPLPADLSALDREALARMVSNLEAQLTASRIRTAEVEAAHTETLNECDRLRAENARLKQEDAAEIAEFNAGYDAGVAGLDLGMAEVTYTSILPDDAPRFDVFGVGYAWAVFEKLKAQLAAARAEVERVTTELAEAERMFALAARKGNRHLEEWRKAEADNTRLCAVLAQVGEAVKARAVEIASYANGREDAGSYIAAEIESIDIAAIGAASASDNAISQAPANSDTLAALTERILNLKSYLDNAPNIELDTSNVRALVDNLAAIVAASAETIHAVRSNQTRPCCSECNEEKNLVYIQTNAEAEEWRCKTCGHRFQFKPPAEGQEAADGKG